MKNMNTKFIIFNKKLITCFLLLFLLMITGGCGQNFSNTRKQTDLAADENPNARLIDAAAAQSDQNSLNQAEGSLWQAGSSPLSQMFINQKAAKVGDILTIRIIESSKASNRASTKTNRKSDVGANLTNFFNLGKQFPASQPFFNPFTGLKAGLESDFNGTGSTNRSGDLTAIITARIVDVLPNGNLMVLGSREVSVNNEIQLITLSGIVRPQDISSDNVVMSTYISDAKIAYSGKGVINDRQRPGWLARILDYVWPF